jgi:hypothetical protein
LVALWTVPRTFLRTFHSWSYFISLCKDIKEEKVSFNLEYF